MPSNAITERQVPMRLSSTARPMKQIVPEETVLNPLGVLFDVAY